MTPKRLTDEDYEIWSRVARTAQRIRPESRNYFRENDEIEPPSPGKPEKKAQRLREAVPKKAETPSAGPSVQIDKKLHQRMHRGKLAPESRLDLHGMTLQEAHPVLISFILNAQARGLRLVLVITGKGQKKGDGMIIPEHRGILKRQVPHWLHAAPCARAILHIKQAHRRHGGDGALYVYLRKK